MASCSILEDKTKTIISNIVSLYNRGIEDNVRNELEQFQGKSAEVVIQSILENKFAEDTEAGNNINIYIQNKYGKDNLSRKDIESLIQDDLQNYEDSIATSIFNSNEELSLKTEARDAVYLETSAMERNLIRNYIFVNLHSSILATIESHNKRVDDKTLNEDEYEDKFVDEAHMLEHHDLGAYKDALLKKIQNEIRNYENEIAEGIYENEPYLELLQLIEKHYDVLIEDAFYFAGERLGVEVNIYKGVPTKQDTSEDEEQEGEEEEGTEAWQVNFKNRAALDSITVKVRRFLGLIKDIDKNGQEIKDEIFEHPVYVDADTAHKVLIEGLSVMNSSKDLIPTLKKLRLRYPWVQRVIDRTETDPSFAAQLYSSYRNATHNYAVIGRNGNLKYLTGKAANRNTGKAAAMNNIKTGNVLNSSTSTYTVVGKDAVISDNVEETKKNFISAFNTFVTQVLHREYVKRTGSEEVIDFSRVSNDSLWSTSLYSGEDLINALSTEEGILFATNMASYIQGLGINVSINDVLYEFKNIENAEESLSGNSTTLNKFLATSYQLKIALESIQKEYKLGKAAGQEHVMYPTDWETSLQKANNTRKIDFVELKIKNIAEYMTSSRNRNTEGSVRIGDSTKYVHTKPSYLNNLMDILSNKASQSKAQLQEWLMNNYLKYAGFGFKGEDKLYIYNAFLKAFYNNPTEVAQHVEHLELENYKGKPYEDWTPTDYLNIMYTMYNAGETNWGYFPVPVLSDKYSSEFIKLPTYTSKEAIHNISILAMVEIARMQEVKARENIKAEEKLQNYDTRGKEFVFLSPLNEIKDEEFLKVLSGEITFNTKAGQDIIEKAVKSMLNNEYKKFAESSAFKASELNKAEENDRMDTATFFANYVYNYATIMQLTINDPAYYKSNDDMFKRIAQLHSPSTRLYTEAKDHNGNKVGKETERTVILKDEVIAYDVISELESILDKQVEDEKLTAIERDMILSKYEQVNVTDAQGFRTVDSYKSVMQMLGRWTVEQENTLQRMKEGSINAKDLLQIWQPLKPFMYGHSDVTSKTGKTHKVYMQNKNSEFLLGLALMYISNSSENGTVNIKDNTRLQAITKFAEENDIDLIQFDSAVKTGQLGVVDLNGIEDNQVLEVLEEALQNNPKEVVHEVAYENYGIQNEVPPHFEDHSRAIGTQVKKLITEGLQANSEFEVNGKTLNRNRLLQWYNNLLTTKIFKGYEEAKRLMSNPKAIHATLMQELGSSRYSKEIVKAITMNEKGEFALPLFEPLIGQKIQEILGSKLNTFTQKLKMKGGSLVQVSNFGFTKQLRTVTDEKTGGLSHIEVMLPAYTKKFYQAAADANGNVDINAKDEKGNYIIPQDLREAIGYRVPTESKYSMLPMKIVGFLPKSMGTAIMMPADITQITGSDFDIDKLYIILPEFKTNRKYNKRTGKSKVTFEKIKSAKINDDNKIGENENSKSINNAIFDVMMTILRHPDTLVTTFKGSTTKDLAQTRDVIKALRISRDKWTSSFEAAFKAYSDNKNSDNEDRLYANLANEAKELLKTNSSSSWLLSPSTHLDVHKRNMMGSKLIGSVANNNVAHAIIQYGDVAIGEEYRFTLNGRQLFSFSHVEESGQTTLDVAAQYMGGAVDNAKDSLLGDLNQNLTTINITMMLTRLGYSIKEVNMFMNQPALVEMSDIIEASGTAYPDIAAIIDNLEKKYSQNLKLTPDDMTKISENELSVSDLMSAISNPNTEDSIKLQLSVLNTLRTMVVVSDRLKASTLALKSDTSKGGNGPTIAHSKLNVNKVTNLLDKISKEREDKDYPVITGLQDYLGSFTVSNNPLVEEYQSYPNMYIKAHHDLGVASSIKHLKNYFPQASMTMDRLIDMFKGEYGITFHNAEDLNKMFNDFMYFMLTSKESFGTTLENKDKGTEVVYASDKRKAFLNNFYKEVKALKDGSNQNSEMANLSLIQDMEIEANAVLGSHVIKMKSENKVSSIQREQYSNDWETLFFSDDTKERDFAINLFKYSIYRNGFNFLSDSFIHYAPTSLKRNLPQYIEGISMANNESISDEDIRRFQRQYVQNNLRKGSITKNVELNSSIRNAKGESQVSAVRDSKGNVAGFSVTVIGATSKSNVSTNEKQLVKYWVYDRQTFRSVPVVEPLIQIVDNKGNVRYYRYVGYYNDNGYDYIQYNTITPAGMPNQLVEYDYHAAGDVHSIVDLRDSEELRAEIQRMLQPVTNSQKTNAEQYDISNVTSHEAEEDGEITSNGLIKGNSNISSEEQKDESNTPTCK